MSFAHCSAVVEHARPAPLRAFIRILMGAVVVFAILVCSGLVLLRYNPGYVKVALEEIGSRVLDRKLVVGTVLEVELGWDTYLLASKVSLANPDWAETADFVQLEHFLIRINLPSIWQEGPILINELELKGLNVTLLAPADQAPNWDLWPASGAQDSEINTDEQVFPVLIRDGSVVGAEITFRDPDQDVVIALETLTFKEPGDGALINLDLTGRVNDIPIQANGNIGPTTALLTQKNLRFDLDLLWGQFSLEAKGVIADLLKFLGPDIKVKVSSPHTRPLLDLLGMPEVRDGPLQIDIAISDAHPGVAVKALGSLGEFDFKLNGKAAKPLAGDGFEVHFSLDGPSLYEVGAMFDLMGLPKLSYDLSGAIYREGTVFSLRDGLFKVGSGQLSIVGQLPNFPEIDDWDLQLKGENFDLAMLGPLMGVENLPAIPYDIDGRLHSSSKGVESLRLDIHGQQSSVILRGVVGEAPDYLNSHVDVKIDSEDLSAALNTYGFELEGLPAFPISINGRVSGAGSRLKIHDTKIESGESVLTLSGSLHNPLADPSLDLSLKFTSPDVMTFLPPTKKRQVAQLPVKVGSELKVSQQNISIKDFEGQVGGASIMLDGLLSTQSPYNNSRVTLEAHGADLNEVLAPWLDKNITSQSFDVSLDAIFKSGGVRVDKLEANVADVSLSAKIVIDKVDDLATTHGNIQLAGPSSQALAGLLQLESVVPDAEYLLNVDIQKNGEWLRLEPVSLDWGGSDYRGSINYKPGKIPTVNVDMHSKRMSLPFLLPDKKKLTKEKAARLAAGDVFDEAVVSKELSTKELTERVIPDEALHVSWLNTLQGSFKYQVDKIYINDTISSSATIELSIVDGTLSSQELHLAGEFFIGDAELSISATEQGAEIDVYLDMQRLPLILMMGGQPKYHTNSFYRARIETSGNSLRELAKNANGAIAFSGGGGRLDNKGLGLILGDVIAEIAERINPLSQVDSHTQIVCHAGAMTIKGGTARLKPGLAVRTSKMDIVSSGSIDLGNERLDIAFNTRSRKGVGLSAGKAITPYFKIGGTLANPRLTIDAKGVALSGGAAVATAGVSILAESLWDRWIVTAQNPCKKLITKLSKKDKRAYKGLLKKVP